MSARLGSYELLHHIGRGGMADVMLARRRTPGGLEKRLVVKCIRRDLATDPRFLKMFVNEAQLSMLLSHKNIVPVFDFGRVGDQLFLVMEYVDGANLAEALKCAREQETPLAPVLAAHIASEACQALDYAQRLRSEEGVPRQIAHRDVSPANILLSFSGEAKLTDFGIAAALHEPNGTRRVVGTPHYMAPEQALGQNTDGRSDLYSLGLVLWELLADRRARPSGTAGEVLEVARTGQIPELPEDVPEELRTIVSIATSADPDGRYCDARAMQTALDTYAIHARAGTGVDSSPLSQRLAAWLSQLFPDGRDYRQLDLDRPAGAVATFLHDGSKSILAGEDDRDALRSMAETMVDAGDATVAEQTEQAEPTDDQSDPTGAANQTAAARPSRRPASIGVRAAAVLAVAAGVVISVAAWPRSPSRATTPPTSTGINSQPLAAAAPVAGSDHNPEETDSAGDSANSPPRADQPADPPDRPAGSPERSPGETAHPTPTGESRAPGTGRDAPRTDDRTETTPGSGDSVPSGVSGAVKVSSSPWAAVKVAGRGESCDETPCQLSLPPGSYSLVMTNPVNGWSKTVSVAISAGETVVVNETLSDKPNH